jgi:hypothetical protein
MFQFIWTFSIVRGIPDAREVSGGNLIPSLRYMLKQLLVDVKKYTFYRWSNNMKSNNMKSAASNEMRPNNKGIHTYICPNDSLQQVLHFLRNPHMNEFYVHVTVHRGKFPYIKTN